jgi:hypothetical protein
MRLQTTTFSVRLTSEEQRHLDRVFSLYGLTGFNTNSERFRKLLLKLLHEKQEPHSFTVSHAEASRNPCEWYEAFDKVGWLETHFPGDRELQVAVARLLAKHDNSGNWQFAIDRLEPPKPQKPFKPDVNVMDLLR